MSAASSPTAALLAWYSAHGRDLPWRRTTDPYAILVSEVMCQQTQVARVVPRYLAWLGRWPSAARLAAASRHDVLAEWVGLGYNARAVRLHEACAAVARDGWPEDLRELPGVGPYTAAAVGSFAFGRDEVVEDTNARRVFTRFGEGLAPRRGQAAAFNNAVMELGATHCRARVVDCGGCPLASWCPSAGAVVVPGRRTSGGERFEDTNRWVRGRVVAALAAGDDLPSDIGHDRLERAIDGLVADGVVRRREGGLSLG